jgi:putative acetyltransferase
MAPFDIRVGSAEDAPGICAAHIASIRVLNAPFYRPEQIEAWVGMKRPEDYTQAMQSGTQFFVGIKDGRVLGFSCVNGEELTGLYLSPEAVGQGLGKALYTQAEDWARSQGRPRLYCDSSLQAEGFYRHQGFVELERLLYPLRGGTQSLEAIKMRKDL